MKTRIEHDLLGEKEVPAEAYYGIQTLRGIENFHNISGITISDYPNYVKALAMVKWAAAKANQELEILPDNIADAITHACEEIISGKLHDQFPVDLIQGGLKSGGGFLGILVKGVAVFVDQAFQLHGLALQTGQITGGGSPPQFADGVGHLAAELGEVAAPARLRQGVFQLFLFQQQLLEGLALGDAGVALVKQGHCFPPAYLLPLVGEQLHRAALAGEDALLPNQIAGDLGAVVHRVGVGQHRGVEVPEAVPGRYPDGEQDGAQQQQHDDAGVQ